MTNSAYTSHPLFPATLVISHWPDVISGHGGRDGGNAWAHQHRLKITKADPAMTTSASNRDQHWVPGMAPFPQVISQLFCDRVRIRSFSSRYKFAFHAWNVMQKLWFTDLQNALLIIMKFHKVLFLIMSFHSKSSEAMDPCWLVSPNVLAPWS